MIQVLKLESRLVYKASYRSDRALERDHVLINKNKPGQDKKIAYGTSYLMYFVSSMVTRQIYRVLMYLMTNQLHYIMWSSGNRLKDSMPY